MGWLHRQKAKHMSLGIHKILAEHDDIVKTILRWCWKMNACAHSLSCFPKKWTTPLFDSCSNGGMEAWIVGGKSSRAHLRWAWNRSGPKLLTPITPNKNGQSFYKNLDVMIGVTSFQLPKYIIKVRISIKTRPIPPLKIGRKVC